MKAIIKLVCWRSAEAQALIKSERENKKNEMNPLKSVFDYVKDR
jgi:hypothetical protein